jgi:hypothetical protein
MTKKPIPVTFDTNAGNLVADPVEYASLDKPPGTAKRLERAIIGGCIQAFVSEASVFVECLSFADKLTYLAVAGRQGQRPTPDPRRVAIFDQLERLGIRLLHAPLIAAEKFIEMPWAADERYPCKERLERFGSFIRPLPRQHPLILAGEERLRTKPLLQRTAGMPAGQALKAANDWALVFKRDWDEGDTSQQKSLRKDVEPLIGEWCDALIVGSHYAYGNEYFCTTDEGKQAGSNSLLHHSNRNNLAAEGIKIVSPAELVSIIDALCRSDGS